MLRNLNRNTYRLSSIFGHVITNSFILHFFGRREPRRIFSLVRLQQLFLLTSTNLLPRDHHFSCASRMRTTKNRQTSTTTTTASFRCNASGRRSRQECLAKYCKVHRKCKFNTKRVHTQKNISLLLSCMFLPFLQLILLRVRRESSELSEWDRTILP